MMKDTKLCGLIIVGVLFLMVISNNANSKASDGNSSSVGMGNKVGAMVVGEESFADGLSRSDLSQKAGEFEQLQRMMGMIYGGASGRGSGGAVLGVLEGNNDVANRFCDPQSLNYCAVPEPHKLNIDPYIMKVVKRMWNPSAPGRLQGPMGAQPLSVPTIAMSDV